MQHQLECLGMADEEAGECEIKASAIEMRMNEDQKEILEHTHNKKYCDVLLIVSGGTLTMVNTDHGYVAAPGLANRLKTHSSLYDAQHAQEIDLDEDTLVTPPTIPKTLIS